MKLLPNLILRVDKYPNSGWKEDERGIRGLQICTSCYKWSLLYVGNIIFRINSFPQFSLDAREDGSGRGDRGIGRRKMNKEEKVGMKRRKHT